MNASHNTQPLLPSLAPLQGHHILLGISGGIAAYKTPELVRLLRQAGASVQVVMTSSAQRFTTATTLQAVSGRSVWDSIWEENGQASSADGMGHIHLAREASLVLIAPATADCLARLAQGRADDLLTALCLARTANLPLLCAPAMNMQMWLNPATQRNVALLKQDGVSILGPADGEQACGEFGPGRMLEPAQLLEAVITALRPAVLRGKRVVVTAGPSFEAIDPVRGITNHSSGKFGYAIAQAARRAGAEVILLSGPCHLPLPDGVRCERFTSAASLLALAKNHASQADVLIATAAVADWSPRQAAAQKIKKTSRAMHSGAEMANQTTDQASLTPFAGIEWQETPDVLAYCAKNFPKLFCVGFAAETENLAKHAAEKRQRKGVPLLVGNLAQDTFGQDEVALSLFSDQHPDGETWPRMSKQQAAQMLIDHIAKVLG